MNLFRLRAVAIVLLVVVAFSCGKDDPIPPFDINNSVTPVDFLTDKNYNTLNIEVAWVDGSKPTQTSLNNLNTFLQQRINKSGGITITQRTIPTTGKSTLDVSAIREIERSYRKSVASGKNLTLWVVFLDAESSQSTDTEKVLGVAYGASSLAIFSKSVYGLTPYGETARIALETFVLTHESGHILGLVNNRTPMVTPHQDTEHGAHCSNTNCLMYWKAQSNLKLNDPLGADAIPKLDDNCLADLKASGGK